MLLQEVVVYNLSKGENVHVAYFDIKKAFDTVYIPGLLYKLYTLGMEKKIWKIAQDSYNFQCAALVAGELGPWFVPERSIHQGAPLSKPFYQIYI